jgi:hypothetical protein
VHLEPSDASVRRLIERGIEGPVTMLNLLRLRAQADYSAFPTLAPAQPVSGLEAYQRYIRHTLPFLSDSGGSLEFIGCGGHYLVGPTDERWDLVMLVKQPSITAFLAFLRLKRGLHGRDRPPHRCA